MQALREIVDSSLLNNIIYLPENMKNRKVEIIILPVDYRQESKKDFDPEEFIGILKLNDVEKTLKDMRGEWDSWVINSLIDTNIIIYYLNNSMPEDVKHKTSSLLMQGFNISVITKMELLGFKEHTEESFNMTNRFLSNANIIALDDVIVDKVIQIKRDYSIKLPDAIIGVSALINNLVLITRNTEDFKKIGIKVLNPFIE